MKKNKSFILLTMIILTILNFLIIRNDFSLLGIAALNLTFIMLGLRSMWYGSFGKYIKSRHDLRKNMEIRPRWER